MNTLNNLFDQNQWYSITIPQFPARELVGLAVPSNKIASSTFFQKTNTSHPAHRWQIYYMQNNTFILRSQASGPNAYLSVRANTTTESQIGGTTAIMKNADKSGDEAYWILDPYKSGRFALVNRANGTSWHLFSKDGGRMAMTSNIAGEQDNQSFNFTQLGKINDQAFSTIQTPAVPTGGTGDSPPDPEQPTGTDAPVANESSGLPTSTKIAIGSSVGAFGLIAIITAVFFLLRRRRRKNGIKQPIQSELDNPHMDPPNYEPPMMYKHTVPYEMDNTHAVGELQGTQRQELAGESAPAKVASPVELDGGQHHLRHQGV